MKIKKILILLLGILLLGAVFCNNQVKAIEVNQEYMQNILDLVPSNINLELNEVEFEQSEQAILSSIRNILIENNIQCTMINTGMVYNNYCLQLDGVTINNHNIEITANTSPFYLGKEYFYKSELYIEEVKDNTTYNSESKKINLIYKNTNKYNSIDEAYVKALKIESPRIFEMDLEKMMEGDFISDMFSLISDYYTNLVNESSIVIKATAGAGGGDYLVTGTSESGTHIAIFKNGIFYDTRIMGPETIIPVINVPSTISDDDFEQYAIRKIRQYCTQDGNYPLNCEITLEKGSDYFKNIKDIYTVHFVFANGVDDDNVIIKKQISKTDNETNIKLDTTTSILPPNTNLVVSKITDQTDEYNTIITTLDNTTNELLIYNIKLESEGQQIQPNGKVKISIPIPNGFNKEKLVIYRIENNTKTKYNITIESIDGIDYAVFETDHFSMYVLTQEIPNNIPFKDVPKTSWYYSGVQFTYENGMFKGYTETEFAPMDKVTRGQLVTVLYRFEKEPDVSHIENKFTDVKDGKYYTDAVKWASEIGLVKGYGGTTKFGPNDPILRQDLAIVLQKYAEYRAKDYETVTDISYFADYNKVAGKYAENAIKWAVAKGIISGNLLPDGNKLISPFDNATRAEIAAMLMRFIQNFDL